MDDKKEYIDREAVLTVLKTVFDETDPAGEEQFGILKAHRIVREAPEADVAPVVYAEWIHVINGAATCSRCGTRSCEVYNYENVKDFRKKHFCAHCGAKMRDESYA